MKRLKEPMPFANCKDGYCMPYSLANMFHDVLGMKQAQQIVVNCEQIVGSNGMTLDFASALMAKLTLRSDWAIVYFEQCYPNSKQEFLDYIANAQLSQIDQDQHIRQIVVVETAQNEDHAIFVKYSPRFDRFTVYDPEKIHPFECCTNELFDLYRIFRFGTLAMCIDMSLVFYLFDDKVISDDNDQDNQAERQSDQSSDNY